MRQAVPALAGLLTCAIPDVSHASLTFYSDPAEFAAAAPNLTHEDFEEGNVGITNGTQCSDPYDATTTDACWTAADIAPRLSVSSSTGGGTYILGAQTFGFPTKVTGALQSADATRLRFGGGTLAAGADVRVPDGDVDVTVTVYGPGDVSLGSTIVGANPTGQFLGITSTTAITRVDFAAAAGADEFVDDVRYGGVLDADLRIAQTVVEGPPGMLTHTFVVTNQGQAAASGVVASDSFPAQLAYVSDDCSGANGAPWTWTIGALGAGASVQCKVTTSIVTSGEVFTNVASVDANVADPSPGDNSATAWLAPGLSSYFTDAAAFAQAAPDLVVEDFEEGDVAPAGEQTCAPSFSSSTNDPCWDANDIAPHLAINTDWVEANIRGAGAIGNASIVAGVHNQQSGGVFVKGRIFLRFPEQDTTSVGFDVLASETGGRMDVSVFGADDLLLGKTVVVASPPGTFVGFTTLQPIDHVTVTPINDDDTYIDDVRFGPAIDTDLSIALDGSENPGGTMKIAILVANNGALDATNVAVSFAIPPALTYVSDDCGGANAPAWTWTGFTVPHGGKSGCTIVASVAAPQGFLAKAQIDALDQVDPLPGNDKAFWIGSATGAGPGTPASGFALFRSFADLPFKDQNGAAFSLRDHADQVLLLQVCTVWCAACQAWTSIGDDLQAAVEQRIGSGHFLAVDMLVQSGTSGPSTQAIAANWKNTTGFPGTVLHAEGSKTSALWKMVDDLSFQYADVPAQFSFPDFFILAPGCDNQIAVRATPGPIQLGEERRVDTATVDEMAGLIADVWQQHSCVQPLLHRIDRCSAGAAPILSVPQDGTSVESADTFRVPEGETYDIGYVTAITDAAVVDIALYADAGGFPGATACSSSARAATTLNAPNVKKFRLEPACTLGPGDYWLSLKARAAPASEPLNWFAGVLPRDVPFALRDSQDSLGIGCTDWIPGSSCLGEQASTELCFMLETDDGVFHSGFESPP